MTGIEDYPGSLSRIEHRVSSTENQTEDLDNSLRSLRYDLENLQTQFGHTDDLDYELRDIRDDISSCERDVRDLREEHEDLEGGINDTASAVKRLTQQMQLLEGRLQAVDGVPEADFESFTTKQRTLAQQILRRHTAQANLFDPTDRSSRQYTIDRYHQAERSHRHHQEQALATAAQLLELSPGRGDHAAAVKAFRGHVQEEKRLRKSLPEQEAEAEEAQEELDLDEEERAELGPVLAAGERAQQRLLTDLRSRIAEAVAARRLLPVWFATVLGPAPPAARTQEWMEAAAQLLLYRLTYGVEDRVVALGKDTNPLTRHGQWRNQLAKDMRSLR